MKWKQLFKNAIITAIGAPIVYWVLVQIIGPSGEPATAQTYIIVAIASVIGGVLGEILRQKNRKN